MGMDEGVAEMSPEIVSEFRPTVLHNYNRLPVNSLAFSPNGQKLAVASDDAVIAIYKVDEDGSQEKSYENTSEPHGVSLITYAASNIDVIYATTNGDNTIRRFDTNATKYCQTFQGHSTEIFNLQMGSGSNNFVSSAKDGSVLLWDLRQEKHQVTFPEFPLPVTGVDSTVVAIDPESLIVAIGTRGDRSLRLFDLREVEKGPFSTSKMWAGDPRLKIPSFGYDFEWESMSFSENGKMLLITTSGPYIPVFDALTGIEKYSLKFESPVCYQSPKEKRLKNDAVFTPDSKYILAAGDDGCVHVFETEKGSSITNLNHHSHRGAVGSLKFNPQFMMFATGRMQTALWLPQSDIQPGNFDNHSRESLIPPVIVAPMKKSAIEIRLNANKRVEEVITRRRSARLVQPETKDDLDKDLEAYMSLRKSRPQRLIAPVRKSVLVPPKTPEATTVLDSEPSKPSKAGKDKVNRKNSGNSSVNNKKDLKPTTPTTPKEKSDSAAEAKAANGDEADEPQKKLAKIE